ncbi:MAG TPA: OmpH family outer membrane protein [Alphaproteobacteria bacterium]
MKNVFSISPLAHASKAIAFAALLMLAVAPVAAHAEEKKPTAAAVAATKTPLDHLGRIAVVDTQFLVSNSTAGKSIRSQLEKQRATYKTQIEKQEAELRAGEKKLIEQQKTMTKEQFMAERKKFQEKVIAAQKSVQQRRIAFDKAYNTAMSKLREHIVKIVADHAGKEGISLVLARQDLVLVDARMDMTQDILKALNAKVSSIPVSIN